MPGVSVVHHGFSSRLHSFYLVDPIDIYLFRTEVERLLFPHIRPANTSPHLVTAANMSASRCQSCDHKGQSQFSLYFTNVYSPNIAIQYIVSQWTCQYNSNRFLPVHLVHQRCQVSKSQIVFITVVLRVWMQIGSRQVTMGYVALSQVPQPTLWLSVSVGESGYSYRCCTHLEPMYLLLQPDDGIYLSIRCIT